MNRQAPTLQISSFEKFLEFEKHSQVRHEFVDGNLFVMAGGSKRHDHICNALRAHLFFAAQQSSFFLHGSDMLVRTPDEIGYYPDAMIVTDQSADTKYIVRRPSIIIEVLSESTQSVDRSEKLYNYRSIPSLEQYVLLSQNEALADVYLKQENGTWQHDVLKAQAVLNFPSIGFSLPLAVLYNNLPAASELEQF
jgi:Uma2 family endonuclease